MADTHLSLEEFKARLPIVDVVARWVKLARRGREHWGCCPFHNEKTASFHVVEAKGYYHCFGCGAHGNAIDFVMEVEKVDFPEALERLADITGLPSPKREGPQRPKAEPGLYDANEAAAAWLQRQLAEPAGRGAASYLAGRGVPPELVARFRLGYGPAERTAMRKALLAQGFSDDLLVRAGLLVRPEDGGDSFDRFRDRVIFPIADARGRVVGFGGRALGDAKAKYLNSPETELFHKGSLLYNLAGAARPVRAAGTVLLVEGYMDVIGLAGAGIDHAVAPLGTAVTEEQLAEIWRLADEPILCLDGDAAGLRAAERAADRALPLIRPGRSLRFVLLPPGEDPDSLVRRQGAEAMLALLRQPMTLAEFLWRQAVIGVALDTPERRAAAERRLMERLATIGDRDVRSHYRRELGARLRELWRGSGRKGAPPPRPQGSVGHLAAALQHADRRAEQGLIEPFLLAPSMLSELEEELGLLELHDPELDALRCEILAWYAGGPPLDAEELRTHLRSHGFEPLLGRILHLRTTARFLTRGDEGEDAREAWRLAAARHGRSVARRTEPLGVGSTVTEISQIDVIARIKTHTRVLDEAGAPAASEDDASS
ncbi:MAG TPA: DNA primase [Geminicoccaceae bacterium]|nr:DNA primase [Geminicoccus sp.]HMU50329.1 DNA primase [Geminicoccaceae bacterium]